MANADKKILNCFCYWGGERIVNTNGTFLYKGGICAAVVIEDGISLNELFKTVCDALKTSLKDKIFFYNTKRDKTKHIILNDEKVVTMLFRLNEDEVDVFVEETGRTHDPHPLSDIIPSGRDSNVIDHNATSIVGGTATSSSMPIGSACTQEMGLVPYLPENANEVLWGKGQLFESPDLFKQAVTIFAALNKFSFKYLDNSRSYYRIVCVVKGCPWKVTAKCDGECDLVRVIALNNEHVHSALDGTTYKPTIRTKQVGLIFKNKILDKPQFLPRDICKEFEVALGCRLTYNQGWRAKERAKEAINGPPSASFHLVPWMCRRLVESIPNTIAKWTSTDEGKFKQLFVSYGCSIAGFNRGCRPVLKLDACFLTGYYRGHCLSASAHDADDGLYPLAYAIVSSENDEDWLWFLENLKEVVGGRQVVLVTDRNTSLLNGIIKVFGGECNAWCLRHLKENFSTFVSSKGLKNERRKEALKVFTDIAYARTEVIYKFHLGRMSAFHPDLAKWVEDSKPKHWANAYFPFKRWDKMYTNLAECFNNWILPLRELDILQFMIGHVNKVTDLLVRKKAAVLSWKLPVGPNIDKDIKEAQMVARKYMHRATSPSEFTVWNTERKSFAVRLTHPKTCSCLAWQMSGVPCGHACRAIINSGFSIYDMVDPMMTKDMQIVIYDNSMSPVPLHDMPPVSSLEPNCMTVDGVACTDPALNPPAVRRQAGRPRKRRIESQTQEKATVTCSRCREPGHNRSTCQSAIPG
ncbi:hypothetical protein Vadar_004037 [Vaccinium darrowii]|uniref:Uncharacterized protein n=1 Tax=Vaccinium darrowii TaxID=229202 RepID=A0ACB7YT59_9ERIC|nr:hypothetical protein Vadar_004037 [Vaccinium darrowii]